MVPPVLTRSAEQFRLEPRIQVEGGWESDGEGRWNLTVTVDLHADPTDHLPARTGWRLVVGPKQPDDGVYFYPDAVTGLAATFRHQDANRPAGEGMPWRLGKPCLERPIGALGRDQWGDEPHDLEDRILWKAGRLLQWLDAAATDTLANPGDANELPAGLGQGSLITLGFSESTDSLEWARTTEAKWGFASTVEVPGAKSTTAVTELLDPSLNPIRRLKWGSTLSGQQPSIRTVWLLARALPISAPWTAPATWRELCEILDGQGIALADILVQAGARWRHEARVTAPLRMLIGFPFAARVGSDPERIHWLAIGKVPLAGPKEKRDGFRPIESSRRTWDRQLAGSRKTLPWIHTENWSPDQLGSRGMVGLDVQTSRILVLGAGSLGSAVAENLCRAGVRNLGIMDGERLHMGNVVRHTLTMEDIGHVKADVLAKRLNGTSPNVVAMALPYRFEGQLPDYAAEAVRSYDVVVDCTGSDDVLQAMATFDWRGEKLFVSLSMTWGAEGLLAFRASEASFPAVDAMQRFADVGAPTVRSDEAQVEAIGCWSPVFPATADDVQFWAAIGARAVRHAASDRSRRLTYYRRTAQDGVEVIRG